MSTYPAFDVLLDGRDGTLTLLPNQTVHVYDVTNAAALADIASDVNGHVASGSLAVASGTLIRFSFHRADGLCGYAEMITT